MSDWRTVDLTTHVDALRAALRDVAAVGDATETALVERLAAALEPAFRLRLLEVLEDAARELTEQLPYATVEVRLEGGEPVLVVVDAEAPPGIEEELAARLTLRLPNALKDAIEAAAAAEAVSANAWLLRAIARSTARRARSGPGTRIRGYARS